MSTAPRSAAARRNWGDDDSEATILHVDMDSFFASVEIVLDPQLAGRPLIVGGVGNRGVVTSCTYDVRSRGVRAGMPMSQARALAPGAIVRPGRHGVYRDFSHRVMELMAQVTPTFEPISIDEAFLDVAGARRRLGSPTQIGADLRREIRERIGVPASVGISSIKTVAKIASSHAKPDGLLLIPAAATVQFLHSLPIGALPGVGRRTAESLERQGIETVQQLAHAGEAVLTRVVGEASAIHLLRIAWGQDDRPVGPGRAEKSISTEETFSQNVVDRAALKTYLLEASHDCATRLRQLDLVAWTVQIKLRDGSFRTITRSITLSAPSDLGREIGQAALILFDREKVPANGIRLAGVGVHGLAKRSEGVQIALDEDGRPLAAERAMDAVNHRFGKAALTPATLLSGKRTE